MNRRDAMKTAGVTALKVFVPPTDADKPYPPPHHSLFESAKRFGETSPRPKFVLDADHNLDWAGKELSGKETESAFHVGSGVQLGTHLPTLVKEKREHVLCFADLDHWTYNLPEVLRVMHAFLGGAGVRPSMLWSHTTCWPERSVQRYVNQVDIEMLSDHPACRERPYGSKVALRFEEGSSRSVTIHTGALRWRRLDGSPDGRGPLLKIGAHQIHKRMWNKSPVCGSYREILGASSNDWRNDPLVREGQLPGMRGAIHRVSNGRAGLPRLTRLSAAEETNLININVVLDVFIFKALRLYMWSSGQNLKHVMFDSLAFALDREGLVAYIAASSQRFPGYPLDTPRGAYLHEWGESNGWLGKGH